MQVEMRNVEEIKPYAHNPRHNDAAVDAVAGSIREFGWRVPIVCDEQLIVVAGHTRLKAARKLGLQQVPVHIARGLTPAQLKAYRIADNQTAQLADWDHDKLPLELAELQGAGFDLSLVGFSEGELAELLAPPATDGLTDPDAIPEPPDEAITQSGDLWLLGRHRLLCGDSSKSEDVDRLLDGAPIHLVNTDPPYNVKVEPRSNNAIAAGNSSFGPHGVKGHYHGFDLARDKQKGTPTTRKLRAKDRPLANDFVSDAEFDRLLHAWFGNLARVLLPGHTFYIWGGYANCGNYPPVLKTCGLYFSQAIIWHKLHPVLTRKDFLGDHEWCQPADTQVLTTSGTSRLSALRDHDRVVSYSTHDSSLTGLRDGLEVQVTQRPYAGDLYGVAVGPRQSWSTDGHLWTVRLASHYAHKWCVYLMRRGAWWRVGVTKLRTTWGFGLKGRLCGESGDEAWILTLHDSAADARVYEQLVSVQFGIPQTCWKESPQARQRQRSHIEALYAKLDLDALEQAADAALHAHHRRRAYPFVHQHATRGKFGTRQSIPVRACNLLPEIMELPVPVGGQRSAWQPVRAIDVQPYTGQVYSLGVDQYQHYVADGLVTHNCFYGWREGAAHRFFGPNNVPDVWPIKKVSPQKMIHLTEKVVELATRAIEYSSRKGENVLDLFGGSGSTLIAAEQTGRTAYLMELDPLYADIIVQRFETFTGQKAERRSAGG